MPWRPRCRRMAGGTSAGRRAKSRGARDGGGGCVVRGGGGRGGGPARPLGGVGGGGGSLSRGAGCAGGGGRTPPHPPRSMPEGKGRNHGVMRAGRVRPA